MQRSAKQAAKAQTTGLIEELAGVALGVTVGGKAEGLVGQLGKMGIQTGAEGLILKYSRGDESQADAVGAMILYKAGYNPQAMADFFKTLEANGGKVPPQWLSDHPNSGNREQAIEKETRDWPPVHYASDHPTFQKARQHGMGVRGYTGETGWLRSHSDGSVIFMIFVAPRSRSDRFQPTYEAILKSVKF